MIDEAAWLDDWNSADDARIIERCDPAIEVVAVTLSVDARRYEGYDGIREWLHDVRQHFRARSEATSLEWLTDDALIMAGTLYLRSELGAEMVEQSFAMLITLKHDRARWIGTFANADEARDAWERGIAGGDSG